MTDDDELSQRQICGACVAEEYLREELRKSTHVAACFYCKTEANTWPLFELADRIEEAITNHFDQTNDNDDFRTGSPILELIGELAGLDDSISEDIRTYLEDRRFGVERDRLLEEGPFDQTAHYEGKAIYSGEFEFSWTRFEHSLKHQARFFNPNARAALKQVFGTLSELKAANDVSVIVNAGPGTDLEQLYRARVFQSEAQLKEALKYPACHIGPPPLGTSSAGRMNARGISVFYGATDPETARAEVRPPVGSRTVIGRFAIVRSIRLLDIKAMQDVCAKGSVFDPAYRSQMELTNFLRILSKRMTQPVMPDDEPSEYLVTQAIAEYLALEAGFDGAIYPSAQTSCESSNVVLFHHASRLDIPASPAADKITVITGLSTSDGAEPFYQVSITASRPDTNPEPPRIPELFDFTAFDFEEHTDERAFTLQLVSDSLCVHHIKGITIDAAVFSVGYNILTPPIDPS